MLSKIKSIVTALIVPIMMLAPMALAGGASAVTNPGASTCLDTSSNSITSNLETGVSNAGGGSCSTSNSSITNIATTVVNILSWVIGIVAVIMIIFGGFRYIISGGESNGVSSAKNTLIYAIIGLVIVVLAQVIVHFVINTAGSSTS